MKIQYENVKFTIHKTNILDGSNLKEGASIEMTESTEDLQNEENAYEFKVDFSENIVDGALDKVSDKIAYRFRQRQGQDVGSANIFINDIAPSNWSEGLHFKLGTYEELKDVVFTIPKDNEYYYVEVINIVNEDFSLDELNDAADAVAASSLSTAWLDWEPRISRTPYVLVRA